MNFSFDLVFSLSFGFSFSFSSLKCTGFNFSFNVTVVLVLNTITKITRSVLYLRNLPDVAVCTEQL